MIRGIAGIIGAMLLAYVFINNFSNGKVELDELVPAKISNVFKESTVCKKNAGNKQVVCGLTEAGKYLVEIRASCTYNASYYSSRSNSMVQKTHHADGFPCKRAAAKEPVTPWSKRRAYYPDESEVRNTGEAFILVNGKDVGRLLRGEKHSLFGEFTTDAPANVELIVNEDSGKDGKAKGDGHMSVVIKKVSQ